MIDDCNETWLVAAAEGIRRKRMALGEASLAPRERLTYCLWVADQGMRNAGALAAARELHPAFLEEGRSAAERLGLSQVASAFSLSCDDLEQQYFSLFNGLATAIRTNEYFEALDHAC